MPTTEILMRSLAGVGLLFFGIKMITGNLSAMAGDQLRRGIELVSHRTGRGCPVRRLDGICHPKRAHDVVPHGEFRSGGPDRSQAGLARGSVVQFRLRDVIFAAIFPNYLFALFSIGGGGLSIAFESPEILAQRVFGDFRIGVDAVRLADDVVLSAALLTQYQWFSVALHFVEMSTVFAFLYRNGPDARRAVASGHHADRRFFRHQGHIEFRSDLDGHLRRARRPV